ncbi:85/88 kDa calcium-independent phospholipase A2 [Cichlidogyrus casuarinus]|uniref:85/88 kDa calcium-independent phospholipase A2 n=1 Tax=Cichlidogyrus casuarinus TaxID=1844966 RepID=A0ABD2Q2Z7_9PLAT
MSFVWHAARASGAAPTYFRACGAFLDGGIISNNPSMDILTEIHQTNLIRELHKEPIIPIAVLTSLGTGRIRETKEASIDVFRPGGPIEIFKTAKGISSLGRILVEMSTSADGRIVDRCRAWCASQGTAYFRMSPLLSSDVALDCTDSPLLLHMMWETHAYLLRCRPRLHRLVCMLKSPSR